jgi:hypothetical protein
MQNVLHHHEREQADGEQPGDQRGEIPPGAEPGHAGLVLGLVQVDEVAPDAEEVHHLGELPQQVRPQPGPRQHRDRHQPDHVLRGPHLVQHQERREQQEAQLRQPGPARRGEGE